MSTSAERSSQVSKERLQSFLRGCGIRHSRFRTWETHARAHACRATRNRAAADGRDCPTCRIAAYCESQAEEAEDATRERKERTDASARDFSRCVCVLVVSPILRRPPLTTAAAYPAKSLRPSTSPSTSLAIIVSIWSLLSEIGCRTNVKNLGSFGCRRSGGLTPPHPVEPMSIT